MLLGVIGVSLLMKLIDVALVESGWSMSLLMPDSGSGSTCVEMVFLDAGCKSTISELDE